jgi:hypothetical protein
MSRVSSAPPAWRIRTFPIPDQSLMTGQICPFCICELVLTLAPATEQNGGYVRASTMDCCHTKQSIWPPPGSAGWPPLAFAARSRSHRRSSAFRALTAGGCGASRTLPRIVHHVERPVASAPTVTGLVISGSSRPSRDFSSNTLTDKIRCTA